MSGNHDDESKAEGSPPAYDLRRRTAAGFPGAAGPRREADDEPVASPSRREAASGSNVTSGAPDRRRFDSDVHGAVAPRAAERPASLRVTPNGAVAAVDRSGASPRHRAATSDAPASLAAGGPGSRGSSGAWSGGQQVLELDLPPQPLQGAARRRTASAAVPVATRDRPGDLTTRGPLADLGALLSSLFAPVLLALLIAVLSAVVASRQLSAGFSVGTDMSSVGMVAALTTAGSHPGVVLVWFVIVVVGLVGCWVSERVTRNVWAAGVIGAAVVAGGVLGLGAGAAPLFALMGSGWVDDTLVPFALANLPPELWASGLAVGVGYIAGRKEDNLLGLAALSVALFVAWRSDVVRADVWAGAVTDAGAAVRARLPDAADTAAAAFDVSRWAMHARALADVLLLLSPMLVVRQSTQRGVGAAAAARYL